MRHETELPAPIRRILLEEGVEIEPPAERRIFTNRDLNLDKIAVVGFDMDYTLAIYIQEAVESISLECTVDKLIARGYPERLAKIRPDPRFAIRGLMVDRELGNVLKQDRHGYVGRAYHGRTRLDRATRKAVYRTQRLGRERPRFMPVDTLFALPEVTLYAHIVDLLDHERELWGADAPSYAEAFQDVRASIDLAHQDGSIKTRIRSHPEQFLVQDRELAPTLHKLRSAGKRLFLLTNSHMPYTDALMGFLLGGALPNYEDWRAYFDWIVVASRKPNFFAEAMPFQEVAGDGSPVGDPVAEPRRHRDYAHGNQAGLQAALGVFPDEVLYVGDHIYGDIVRSKKSSGWRTALVVQDLEHDLAVRRSYDLLLQDIENLYELRARLAQEISVLRHIGRVLGKLDAQALTRAGAPEDEAGIILEAARQQVRRRFDRLRAYRDETRATLEARQDEVDGAFNPYWGSMFDERHDASRFGAQVEDYACLYTSRVSNFLYVSPSRYFHSPQGTLPHWRLGAG